MIAFLAENAEFIAVFAMMFAVFGLAAFLVGWTYVSDRRAERLRQIETRDHSPPWAYAAERKHGRVEVRRVE